MDENTNAPEPQKEDPNPGTPDTPKQDAPKVEQPVPKPAYYESVNTNKPKAEQEKGVVEGTVIVSCSCGQAKNVNVKDINEPVDWKCPKPDCKGTVTITGKTRKVG